MKKVVYRDPEHGLQTVRIDDDESGEALEEVLAALGEMYQHYHNLTAMEQYHTAEHMEGLEYEKASGHEGETEKWHNQIGHPTSGAVTANAESFATESL